MKCSQSTYYALLQARPAIDIAMGVCHNTGDPLIHCRNGWPKCDCGMEAEFNTMLTKLHDRTIDEAAQAQVDLARVKRRAAKLLKKEAADDPR